MASIPLLNASWSGGALALANVLKEVKDNNRSLLLIGPPGAGEPYLFSLPSSTSGC